MRHNILKSLIKNRFYIGRCQPLGPWYRRGYMLAVKHPAIAATGTLNGTEITLTESHRHGQKIRFGEKNLEKLSN